ncbi:MAG: hypothetical protein JSW07_03765 [bacterium]|nr:MAG: hypothetical protein JSW07_03765 [bacterium]
MNRKKKIFWILTCWICLALISVINQKTFSQRRSADIGVGSLNFNLDEAIAGSDSLLQYPREYEVFRSQNCVRGEGFIIGARNLWARGYYEDGHANPQKPNKGWVVSDTLKTFDYFVIDGTPTIMLDIEHVSVPVSGAFTKYWKYDPPILVVNKEDLSASQRHPDYEEVSGTIITEQMGYTKLLTSMGITIIERVYVFANPDYDDFALVEYVFKYTGETPNVDNKGNPITYSDPIHDCYVGIKFFPIIYEKRVVPRAGGWTENTDDWVDYTYAEDIDGDGNEDILRVMFGWDGDAGVTGEDDEGDPLIVSSGVFLSPQYPGVAVLHVDKATDDHSNDKNQPHLSYVSWGAVSSTNSLTSGSAGPGIQEVYNILETGGELTPPLDWVKWKETQTDNWLRGTSHPNDKPSQIGTLAFGPYQFNNIGDSIRVLACHTVGTISWAKAIELGVQWKTGAITTTEKNMILRSGRDSLFTKIMAIKELFKTTAGDYDFRIETIAQKITSPPTWPDSVVLSSVTGGCRVQWSEVNEAVSYRVYRRLQPKFYIEQPGTVTYPLVFQSGGDNPGENVKYNPDLVTSWIDENVVPAQYYWYYVTAINADGIESSHFVTRINPDDDDPIRGGITPFEKPPVALDSIYVIPNPYHVKMVRLYPEQLVLDHLNFVGLPAVCRVRIFTQTGDLIATIDHELQFPPKTTESWEMRTSMNQTIASGLYVYVVDNCRDHTNKPINQTKVGKFVVIR